MNKNTLPCIALVGNAPKEKHEILNQTLDEEVLTELCDVILYGADGQPEEEALSDAIEDYRDGKVTAIVCLPMTLSVKKSISTMMGSDAGDCTMLAIHPTSRMTSIKGGDATTIPSKEDIVARTGQLCKILKRDLNILNPRIAMLSYGDEIDASEESVDTTVIAPAITELVNSSIQVFGPIASGKFYEDEGFMAFDAVVAMHSEQCKDAFRKASNEDSVTLLSGVEMPIVLTEAEQLMTAIALAIDVERNRKEYDAPFQAPLQKLYHEKKEDGDKARFAVKRKGFNPAEHRRENVPYPTLPNVPQQQKS